MTYHCLRCGAQYDEDVRFCWACCESTVVVPDYKRQVVQRQTRIQSARDVRKDEMQVVINEAYPYLVVGYDSLVLLVGPPGGGKTVMAMRYANAVKGAVVYWSLEERLAVSLKAKLAWLNIQRGDFYLVDGVYAEDVERVCQEHRAVVLAVDSLTHSKLLPEDVVALRYNAGVKCLIGVVQITKAGRPAGYMELQHLADVVLRVEQMNFTVEKNRFGACGSAGKVLQDIDDDVDKKTS